MSTIAFQKRDRFRAPAGALAINSGHPLALGLQEFMVFNQPGAAKGLRNPSTGGTQTAITDVQGQYGPAKRFNGSSSKIDFGQPSWIGGTGAFTIMAILKLHANASTSAGVIFDKNGVTTLRGWGLHMMVPDQAIELYVASNSTTTVFCSGLKVMAFDTWHVVAAVFKPSTYMRTFVDGALDVELATGVPASTQNPAVNITVGAAVNGTDFFNGDFAGIARWNVALGPTAQKMLWEDPWGVLRPARRRSLPRTSVVHANAMPFPERLEAVAY